MDTRLQHTSATPLVSVCVPTYNGAEFLSECLDSLLDQDLQDLEILVGDDLSSDETLEIAGRRPDPRLRILPFAERAGMAGNWNRCLAEARGNYVALVAQDDLVTSKWGERLVDLLESHSEADLAFCRRDFKFSDERSREATGEFFDTIYPALIKPFYDRIGTVIEPEVIIECAIQNQFEVNLIGEPSFTMIRRDHPATREGYHPDMRQMLDWEFATRFFAGRPILHCPESLGSYRIHSAGSSVGNASLTLQYREYKLLAERVMANLRGQLSASQVSRIHDRLAEFESQLLEHTRTLEAERGPLSAHAKTLEEERVHLVGHLKNLELAAKALGAEHEQLAAHSANLELESKTLKSEREQLLAHLKNLETEGERMQGHIRNLEESLNNPRFERVVRGLVWLKSALPGGK